MIKKLKQGIVGILLASGISACGYTNYDPALTETSSINNAYTEEGTSKHLGFIPIKDDLFGCHIGSGTFPDIYRDSVNSELEIPSKSTPHIIPLPKVTEGLKNYKSIGILKPEQIMELIELENLRSSIDNYINSTQKITNDLEEALDRKYNVEFIHFLELLENYLRENNEMMRYIHGLDECILDIYKEISSQRNKKFHY